MSPGHRALGPTQVAASREDGGHHTAGSEGGNSPLGAFCSSPAPMSSPPAAEPGLGLAGVPHGPGQLVREPGLRLSPGPGRGPRGPELSLG